jgi:prepilin-type N-terminal cleavage/methylation domain-containing protein
MSRRPDESTVRRCRRTDAFSLLEVLVAVTVAAVLLVVLLNGFGLCLRHSGTAEDYTQAALLARTILVDFEQDRHLTTGKRAGTFGKEFDRFRWEATIEQPTSEPWFAVEIRVGFSRRGVDRALPFRTVLPAPGLIVREAPPATPPAAGGTASP